MSIEDGLLIQLGCSCRDGGGLGGGNNTVAWKCKCQIGHRSSHYSSLHPPWRLALAGVCARGEGSSCPFLPKQSWLCSRHLGGKPFCRCRCDALHLPKLTRNFKFKLKYLCFVHRWTRPHYFIAVMLFLLFCCFCPFPAPYAF